MEPEFMDIVGPKARDVDPLPKLLENSDIYSGLLVHYCQIYSEDPSAVRSADIDQANHQLDTNSKKIMEEISQSGEFYRIDQLKMIATIGEIESEKIVDGLNKIAGIDLLEPAGVQIMCDDKILKKYDDWHEVLSEYFTKEHNVKIARFKKFSEYKQLLSSNSHRPDEPSGSSTEKYTLSDAIKLAKALGNATVESLKLTKDQFFKKN